MIPTTHVTDVTTREHRPVTFPDRQAALEQLGYRELGRFTTSTGRLPHDRFFVGAERRRLSAWRARPAYPVLVAPDGSAYASVDSYGDAALIGMVTELADGSLVETVGVDREGMLRPRWGIEPTWPFTSVESSDRSVLLLSGAVPALVVAGHADHVRRVVATRGSERARHTGRDHALRILTRAARHSERCSRRHAAVSRLVGCALIVIVAAVFLTSSPSPGSWAEVVATPVLFVVVMLVLGALVIPLVTRSRRWRPRYRHE